MAHELDESNISGKGKTPSSTATAPANVRLVVANLDMTPRSTSDATLVPVVPLSAISTKAFARPS